VEIRDWVRGFAGDEISTLEGALHTLRTFDPTGNWSIEEDAGLWHLLVGDQWVERSADKAEFVAFVAGAATAVALLRQ
jgi:hypothetical protein